MVTFVRKWSSRLLVASLVLTAIPAIADDAEGVVRMGKARSEGVVRISDQAQAERLSRGQSPELFQTSHHGAQSVGESCPNGSCPAEYGAYGSYCPSGDGYGCPGACGHGHCGGKLCQQLACKFGYFVPSGACGHGAPLMGHYNMAYPVDPSYFDPRDGQVFASAKYGGPTSVPLAPVVNHTFNYGWGVPSSRLTPVLHPVTQTPVAQRVPWLTHPVGQ